jgi:hypothetical protein
MPAQGCAIMADPPRILDRLNAALSGRYALERQLG